MNGIRRGEIAIHIMDVPGRKYPHLFVGDKYAAYSVAVVKDPERLMRALNYMCFGTEEPDDTI